MSLAETTALEAIEQIDALDLELIGPRIGHRQIGGCKYGVTDRGETRLHKRHPDPVSLVREPGRVQVRCVSASAVGHDVRPVQDSREGLQERGLTQQ